MRLQRPDAPTAAELQRPSSTLPDSSFAGLPCGISAPHPQAVRRLAKARGGSCATNIPHPAVADRSTGPSKPSSSGPLPPVARCVPLPFRGPPPHPVMMHPYVFSPPFFPRPYQGYHPYPTPSLLHFPPLHPPCSGDHRGPWRDDSKAVIDFPYESFSAGLSFNPKVAQATTTEPAAFVTRHFEQQPAKLAPEASLIDQLQQHTISSAFDGQDLDVFLKECVAFSTSLAAQASAPQPAHSGRNAALFEETAAIPIPTQRAEASVPTQMTSPCMVATGEGDAASLLPLPSPDSLQSRKEDPESLIFDSKLAAALSDSMDNEIDVGFIDNDDMFSRWLLRYIY